MNIDYLGFLNSFIEKIEEIGIDVSGLEMDHVAYRASSKEEYETLKTEFLKEGYLIDEADVEGRRVVIYKLHQPIKFRNYLIPALELIEPKAGQNVKSGLEHAEFVLKVPFSEFMDKYPDLPWDTTTMDRKDFPHLKLKLDENMVVKFHPKSILEMKTIDS